MVDIAAELKRPKIDAHCHVRAGREEELSSQRLVEAGEMLGITEYWCSRPITARYGSLEEIRAETTPFWRPCAGTRSASGVCACGARVLSGGMRGDRALLGCRYDRGQVVSSVQDQRSGGMAGHRVVHATSVPILVHAGYVTDPRTKAEQLGFLTARILPKSANVFRKRCS